MRRDEPTREDWEDYRRMANREDRGRQGCLFNAAATVRAINRRRGHTARWGGRLRAWWTPDYGHKRLLRLSVN